MKLVSRHGDGSAHRVWEHVLPTRDPWAFWIPPLAPVTEASGQQWQSDYPVAAIFWPQRFYQIFLLLKEDATEYYCNIICPPQYNPREQAIEFGDLDLDVVLMGGKLWVADEDEFAVRRSSYSQRWIREAEAAKELLLLLASQRVGPFSLRTAQVWRALALEVRQP